MDELIEQAERVIQKMWAERPALCLELQEKVDRLKSNRQCDWAKINLITAMLATVD